MIKQTVTYEDFEGNETTETMYFHLSKAELLDMEINSDDSMSARLQRIQDTPDGDARPVLNVLKDFVSKAYGIRSDDGKKFRKSDAIREEFVSSEAYSELLFDLLQDSDKLVKFLTGLMPEKIMAQVRAEQEKHPDEEPTAMLDRLKKEQEQSSPKHGG